MALLRYNLLRFNSHAIRFTLNVQFSDFLKIYLQCHTVITAVSFRTFPSSPKETTYPVYTNQVSLQKQTEAKTLEKPVFENQKH